MPKIKLVTKIYVVVKHYKAITTLVKVYVFSNTITMKRLIMNQL